MPKATAIANGKTVKREGNLPDARMSKNAGKIDGSHKAKVFRVHHTIGGVVHATSHNYGSKGTKGRELKGGSLASSEEDVGIGG